MDYGLKNKLKDDKLYEILIKSLSAGTASRYRYGIIYSIVIIRVNGNNITNYL